MPKRPPSFCLLWNIFRFTHSRPARRTRVLTPRGGILPPLAATSALKASPSICKHATTGLQHMLTDRQAGRQTDRQTDRYRHGQTCGHVQAERDRQTDRWRWGRKQQIDRHNCRQDLTDIHWQGCLLSTIVGAHRERAIQQLAEGSNIVNALSALT